MEKRNQLRDDHRVYASDRGATFLPSLIVGFIIVVVSSTAIFKGIFQAHDQNMRIYRKVKALDDYFVAGRRAPTLLIVGTLVASVFSTSIFLGEAGFTYDGQLGPYLLFPGIAVIGYVYGALLFGTYLRRSRAPTVARISTRCWSG